jgi:TM2 domain-containing membrane protein YozV/RNA polymerase subunit RPABC4/transcription elongation factor Spt4
MSKRCYSCGLINFDDAEICKRCGSTLLGNPHLFPCPDCGHLMSRRASQCPQCGWTLQPVVAKPAWNPGVAAVLSFVIPGLGQMYKGEIGSAIVWFFVVGIAYGVGLATIVCLLPALALHIICVFDAAKRA